MASVRLDKLLSSLGYCSRREVSKLIRESRISVDGIDRLKSDLKVEPDSVRVDGQALDPLQGIVLLMNKPVGYVCSNAGNEGATVYDLLPPRFSQRNPPIVTVGRLDKDTSGLLLFTDDGVLVHRLTSPRHDVEKVYHVTLRDGLRGDEQDLFASGTMLLAGETKPLKPCKLAPLGSHQAEIVLREGRYHQVRRMFEAVGNMVTELKRIRIGGLTLENLAEGSYRQVEKDEFNSKLYSQDNIGRPPTHNV